MVYLNSRKKLEAIPEWFVEHRVQTTDQLADQPLPLQIVRNGKPVQHHRNNESSTDAPKGVLNSKPVTSSRKLAFSEGLRFRQRSHPKPNLRSSDYVPLLDLDREPAHREPADLWESNPWADVDRGVAHPQTAKPWQPRRPLPLIDDDGEPAHQDPADFWQSQRSSEENAPIYRIEDSIYSKLQALLLRRDTTNHKIFHRHRGAMQFTRDAVLLRLPEKDHSSGGLHFCSAIIQRFAQEAGSNLITLDVDDVSDLQQNILRSEDEVNKWQNGEYESYALDLPSSSLDGFPFKEMLSAPGIASHTATKTSHATPLVIHIQEICELVEVHGIPFLGKLREAIAKGRQPGSTIIFFTTARHSESEPRTFAPVECLCGSCKGDFPPQEVTDLGKLVLHSNRKGSPLADYAAYDQTAMLNAVGTNPEMDPIYVEPMKNCAQATLLESHRELESSTETYNIRGLKRWLRQRSNEYHALELLQPFSKWEFMDGTEMQRMWANRPMNHRGLAEQISDTPSDECVKDSILRINCSQQSSGGSRQPNRRAIEKEEASSVPSWLRPIYDIIEKIKHGDEKWEKMLLDCVVTTQDCQYGWDEIAIDDQVKDTMRRVLGLQSLGDIAPYGLMKHSSPRGTLLYGAPGTGKTHLARVLARESGATMICVSAGDIYKKWFGQSEDIIKALFSLGRKLAPTIIFIDEADAMLRRRQSSSSGSGRSLTNQLLHEMDGLKSSGQSPFILLATNHPADLDFAFYRRVPTRAYIGLPDQHLRLRMLQIFLRDEVLDAGVDLPVLARRTQGYSGSDIQTICVQAAMSCDVCVSPRDRRRLLKTTHFETALRGSASTVSTTIMSDLKNFAAEYDPSALPRITRDLKSRNVVPNTIPDEDAPSRHVFHVPDAESNRPNLQNLDANSLWLDSEIVDPNRPQPWETLRADAVVDENEVCATGEPLQYRSLKPNSKQIRVLSVLPKTQGKHESTEEAPRCVMKTVSLEDWTDSYREFLAWMKSQSLPSTPKYRHALWALAGAYSYATYQISQKEADGLEIADLITWTESRLGCDNDWRLKTEDALSPRFKWGDYVALSYVWGNSNSAKDITVNGNSLSVTENLYDALIDLRDSIEISQRHLHVWIDAICINQQDLYERACEVKKMSVIYSESLAVRAWLGQPKDAAAAAKISQIRHFLDATVQVDTRRCTWEMARSFIEIDTLLVGAYMLLTLPHWKRLWIIQEKALAPSLHFVFGREQFMTLDFIRLAGWCFNDPLSRRRAPNISQTALRLQRLRQWEANVQTSNNKTFSIFDIVHFAQTSQASDPRDKVYGLLALLPAKIAKSIQPDYNTSNDVVKVLMHFSRKCYEFDGNLDALARVTIVAKEPGLPTWALDLDCDVPDDEPRGLSMDVARRRKYLANHQLSTFGLSFSENGQLMRCHGVIIDVVESLAEPLQTSNSREVPVPDRGSQLRGRNQQSSAYHNLDLALCRVVMSDEDFQLGPDNPSTLDILWLDPSECPAAADVDTVNAPLRDIPDLTFSTAPVPWPELYSNTGFTTMFHSCLYPNAEYLLGGRRLQDFFKTSTTSTVCQNPAKYQSHLFIAGANLAANRLLTTERGRIGMGPKLARPGDKVAVLCDCDKPMILRPAGRFYEVVGSCFIEGLMKGETARLVKESWRGLRLEELVLA